MNSLIPNNKTMSSYIQKYEFIGLLFGINEFIHTTTYEFILLRRNILEAAKTPGSPVISDVNYETEIKTP